MLAAVVTLVCALVAQGDARYVRPEEWMLANQMQYMANLLQEMQNAANRQVAPTTAAPSTPTPTTSTTPVVPGRTNICDSLCPKWCQRINGTAFDSSHCHYLCGNICYDKQTSMNPFIGNSRYEVVPSEFSFERYDVNGDKLITVDEFASVEGVSRAEVADMFIFTDMNGDGYIDTKEFNGGPLVFTVQMAAELSAMAMEEMTTTTEKPTTM